ncbi:hypothetical protein K492DRAFT_240771 [Lichtheimia hyalospora FSU 10163]|nr:hypothetical protein K492DRAFT_240771 [Lichtheimia hyalospora FSU 10163]
MATMTAHQQYSRSSNRSRRQQEKFGEDVALANYMSTNKMRHHKQKQLDQTSMMPPSAWGYPNMGYPSPAEWAYYQQQYAAAAAAASQQKNGSYQQPYVPYQYYYPNCHPNLWVDTSSPRSIHKSTSTPTRSPRSSPSPSRSSISSQHSLSSFHSQQHHDPRPSRTSSSSSSTVSGASSTEFSTGRRSSITSVSSSVSGMSVSSKRSFSRRIKEVFKGKSESVDQVSETTRVRRRSSIAALSGLFQKHTIVPTVPEEDSTEEQDEQPLPAPPTAPFVKSSCPTPPRTPTISSNVSTVSSLSSSSSASGKKKKIQFYPTIQVHETFSSSEYDRRCDTEATCQKLTPTLAVKIKQELNEYKLTDMEVHVESRRYTHFLL